MNRPRRRCRQWSLQVSNPPALHPTPNVADTRRYVIASVQCLKNSRKGGLSNLRVRFCCPRRLAISLSSLRGDFRVLDLN